MAKRPPALDAIDVSKTFGNVLALDRVTLSVRGGEIVALLGHNGAGKSTFAQLAAGVTRQSSGALRWCDRTTPSAVRVGYVSQDLGIYPRSTVRANLEFMRRLAGTGPAVVARTASALGLNGLLDRLAGRLSGGEKRRLHAALGLVVEPDLLLLDEPTAGADVETRARILHAVRASARAGVAVVYSTHYAPEVEELEARVVVLRRGRVVAHGSVEEIVALGGGHGVDITVDSRLPNGVPDGWCRLDDNRVFVPLDGSTQADSVLGEVRALGGSVSEFRRVQPSLDRALMRLSSEPDAGPAR